MCVCLCARVRYVLMRASLSQFIDWLLSVTEGPAQSFSEATVAAAKGTNKEVFIQVQNGIMLPRHVATPYCLLPVLAA